MESEQSILILWQKKLVKGRYYRRSNRLENRISNLFLKCVYRRCDSTVIQFASMRDLVIHLLFYGEDGIKMKKKFCYNVILRGGIKCTINR